MKTSSAKQKGRRLCALLREHLLQAFSTLQPDDIIVTPSGVPGEDIRLSPYARLLIPFTFEAKNVEKISIWSAIKQARQHELKTKAYPAVVFSKNREPEPWVAVPLSVFTKLVRDHGKDTQNVSLGNAP